MEPARWNDALDGPIPRCPGPPETSAANALDLAYDDAWRNRGWVVGPATRTEARSSVPRLAPMGQNPSEPGWCLCSHKRGSWSGGSESSPRPTRRWPRRRPARLVPCWSEVTPGSGRPRSPREVAARASWTWVHHPGSATAIDIGTSVPLDPSAKPCAAHCPGDPRLFLQCAAAWPPSSCWTPVTLDSPGSVLDDMRLAVAELTQQAPVLLVIEDMHWADRSTQDFALALARTMQGRLLFLFTYRAEALTRAHPSARRSRRSSARPGHSPSTSGRSPATTWQRSSACAPRISTPQLSGRSLSAARETRSTSKNYCGPDQSGLPSQLNDLLAQCRRAGPADPGPDPTRLRQWQPDRPSSARRSAHLPLD